MSNYSSIEKILHRLALSQGFVRQLSFDIEKQFYLKSSPEPSSNHVFVTGLARSGTTILLRAIHESNEFASLTYADMPFVLAPNAWSKLQRTATDSEMAERAHGDGIMVNTESPEAFEEVFWLTFKDDDAPEEFENYLRLILRKYAKQRYLSKNNQNVQRLPTLVEKFPDATFLVPFREPLQHAQSLFSQHKKFNEVQSSDSFVKNYMDWIGHSEFGQGYKPIIGRTLQYSDSAHFDHWIEQWILLYEKLKLELTDKRNVHFVCYESLCSDQGVWKDILSKLALDTARTFEFRESKKPIDHGYDQSLYNRALELYTELREL